MVNVQSQVDYDDKTPGQALVEILKHHDDIIHALMKDKFDFDMYQSDPGGQPVVNPVVRGPYMITDIIASWNAGFGNQPSTENSGTVTSPAAGATITSVVVGSGTFQVTVEVQVNGTVAAIDNDNMKFEVNGVAVDPFIEYIAGSNQPAIVTFVVNTNVIATLSVNAIALATVGAIYVAEIVAIKSQTPQTVTITIGDRVFTPDPQPGYFALLGMHGIQMQNINQPINMTTNPATPAILEVLGYADYRKEDQL